MSSEKNQINPSSSEQMNDEEWPMEVTKDTTNIR